MTPYPKRLIEVDLPIKEISAHARREKSIRHGHISTLHIWWARRPLAACRAVICAALWPDPADELCPPSFREAAAGILADFAEQVRTDAHLAGLVANHWQRWHRTNEATFGMMNDERGRMNNNDDEGRMIAPRGESEKNSSRGAITHHSSFYADMRYALLDFIADFANWDASTVPAFFNTARALTQAAHEALGGLPGTRPLVVDPFAGGGAIPLEALRVGAEAFASDLNPVAVLLNKVVLEYIPKYGQRLADEVRKWGQWIKEQAEQELAEFYPKDPDGATPIAYLWARTIISEAPDDGTGIPVEVPLMRSLWLAKRSSRGVALRWVRDTEGNVKTETVRVTYGDGVTRIVRRPLLEIFEPKKAKEVEEGTMARGSATCPVTGFTTPVASVRRQLATRRGGAADARLFAVVTTLLGQQGRFYRLPTKQDFETVQKAAAELEQCKQAHINQLSLVPDEPLPPQGTLGFRVQLYGMEQWGDLFTARQALALTTLARLVREVKAEDGKQRNEFIEAIQTCLALALDKQADLGNSLTRWKQDAECPVNLFGRQAIPIVWDFAEAALLSNSSGSWQSMYERTAYAIGQCEYDQPWIGQTESASATTHPLPDDAAQAFITDPPYYDAVPYSDLSDFFLVWLKRTIGDKYPTLFAGQLAPKAEECIVDEVKGKDRTYFEVTMKQAMAEGRRILAPDGIGLVVFAHKSTGGWEAQLQAMVDAGWTMTGSWPIDTEMGSRLRAMDSATLASSIHLVCRPREAEDGSLHPPIGDWREVLQELPQRIHAWLPRLACEGVVGADAIFACLGPALEIFSRYSRVEKASGEPVTLKEYLEYVWAAVSKEALSMVFEGGEAAGLEEDARLTAMWLWTLNTGAEVQRGRGAEESEGEDEETNGAGKKAVGGFSLEYDAARKIAQGLGAYLEKLDHLVEVKGSTARLRTVAERARYLFGQAGPEAAAGPAQRSRQRQLSLFENVEGGMMKDELGMMKDELGMMNKREDDSSFILHPSSFTTLDRVHQSMLLFAAGRGDALKRFLVEEGVGRDNRYWALANALSALYPAGTDEKRWVEGVLARKKGLGF